MQQLAGLLCGAVKGPAGFSVSGIFDPLARSKIFGELLGEAFSLCLIQEPVGAHRSVKCEKPLVHPHDPGRAEACGVENADSIAVGGLERHRFGWGERRSIVRIRPLNFKLWEISASSLYCAMTASLEILPGVRIAHSEITYLFTRSRGPGGQNVNKVSSRVELLFDVENSPSLSVDQKRALRNALGKRIGADGVLRIESQESRSQWANREIVLRKFTELLSRALRVRKRRIPSGPTKASGAKRLSTKKHRGGLKSLRRRVSRDD